MIARHRCEVETIVNACKGEATKELLAANLHPFGNLRRPDGKVPHCWARKSWNVYLDSIEDIQRAIPYVEDNPRKEGKPVQRWSFVTPFTPDSV